MAFDWKFDFDGTYISYKYTVNGITRPIGRPLRNHRFYCCHVFSLSKSVDPFHIVKTSLDLRVLALLG